MQIDTLPPLRDVIERYDLDAKKSLGQNFLLDLNLTYKIANFAGDLSNCDVLEVGPGPGGLTRALLAQGARRVVALEKDERCMAALADVAAQYEGKLEVINTDALGFHATSVLNGPTRVVANLPYNIGTELLVRWLTPNTWPPFWDSLTLMFQKEVAERIVAEPSSKKYGRLSVLSQWRSNARIVMTLPPSAFSPAPKVHSAVVHIEKLDHPKYPADFKILQYIVATAFNQRRKMIRSSLKSIAADIEDKIVQAGLKPTARAENITIQEFCALAQVLKMGG